MSMKPFFHIAKDPYKEEEVWNIKLQSTPKSDKDTNRPALFLVSPFQVKKNIQLRTFVNDKEKIKYSSKTK